VRRREFISLLAGAAAWPLAARAQQAQPVVGYLGQGTAQSGAALLVAAREGLREVGLVEGRDFASEIRWANNDVYRLPELATDLVQRRVAVILTYTVAGALAAKAATKDIPIVFAVGTDPVRAGLVGSLNRPGANITGFSTMNLDLVEKWTGLFREFLPSVKRIAVLVNIENAEAARSLITATQTAALAIGLQNEIRFASNEGEIDSAMAGLGSRSQALVIQPDVLFLQNLQRLAALAIREKLPALYTARDFPRAGGLMSYGSSFIEALRHAGIYAGRIIKGEKVGDLPVERATKFDFVINLKTARAIGVDIPPTLLARADEVIE
jgi:putative tryptophan/tyrosine transport system substrate-binding protein